jgi:uncharacterized protein YsxB (DUF464 family)
VIVIHITLDRTNLVKACVASGHAKAGPRGGDIVCAAVSVLLRSFLRTVQSKEGICVQADASVEGRLSFTAAWTTDAGRGFLYPAGCYLVEGLRSVAEEYPAHCAVTIQTEEDV